MKQNLPFKKHQLLRKSLISFLILAFGAFTQLFGQTNTWDGSSSNNWNTAANWSLNAVPTNAHDVVVNKNASILVNVNSTINSLTINNSATVSFTSSGAARTITIDNTGSSIGSGSNLTLQGSTGSGTRSMSILYSGTNRTMLIAGTLTLTAVGEGTIYNASNSLTTITGLFKNDGSSNGTDGVITSTASNLSFSSGGTYEHALDGGTIPTATWDAASTCNVTGAVGTLPTVASFNQSFGNFTWNCTGQSADFSLIGNLTTVKGNFTISSTGSSRILNLAISGATFTTTVQGDYIQSGGNVTLNGTNGACTFNLAGNFTMSGGTLARGNGTGTFNFNGSSIQTFNKSAGLISGSLPFTITTGAVVDFNTSVLDGTNATFNLNSGGSIITANSDGLSSTGATGSIQVGGTRTYSTGANYTYNGTSPQVTGTGLTGTNNFTINNDSGVTLTNNTTVNGILNLTSGIITTGANTLTVSNNSISAVNGGSNSNFVNGPLIWTLAPGSTYTFPVGKGTTYLPFGLSGIAGTAPQIRVEAFTGNTGGTATSPLGSLSSSEYWLASRTAGTFTTGSVSLTRQSSLSVLDAIGRNTTTLNGVYNSLNGTVSGTSIVNSDVTGNLLGYFVMAAKKSITTGTISPISYIDGTSVNVPYTITGTYNANNVFTAQLSDSNGSFASPVNIGSLTQTTAGTISATIPVGTTAGTGYRIRVVSNNPTVTGSDNGTNITVTVIPKTFYSYQSGDWNTSSTWTKDPSGSLGIDIGVPGASDNVVILNARTVKITDDSKNCISLEIRQGGALDLTTTKSHNFTTVIGQGILRLSSEFFPSGNFASFVASNGGTVEYYDLNNKRISNSQLTYNNLIISNSTATATTVFLDNATNPINYILNGKFNLANQSSGSLTFYFGNPTASDNLINMSVNGNFTVGSGCNIRVNNFASAHTIPNLAIGSTLPLPAYPVHTLTLNGDFTNNGSVRFTGLPSPLNNAYYLLTTTASGGVNYGDVQVYFVGNTNNTLTCNGTTDFFRIVLEKGIDQTKILEVNSSSTSNFALYAPNFQGSNSFNGGPEGYGIGAYSKALYIHYGTLKLNANISIPSLTEGGQDFNLIPSACLWLNGATVSTTVSGVNGTGYQAATLYGKLRISSGTFSTGDAAGIVLGILGTPEIRIEGTGILDVSQAWVADGGTNLMSFVQTGGTANFRMRGENQTGPMLGLNNTNTVFTMSGGTLNFSDNTFINNATNYHILDIRAQQGNFQVTGGIVNLNLPSSATTYTANSTVPFYNLNITNKTGTATTSIQWNTPGSDLTILNDLNIGSGSTLNLNTSTVNLVVGHNFTLPSGATYTPGNNTTTFNGNGGQVFTNAGTITTGLRNLVLSNSSNTTISNNLTVLGDLTLNNSCFLNDQGFSVSVAGNVYNSGTHASQANGSIILNGTVAQTIGGSGSGIFGNFTINKTAGTTTFGANQTITGNLRLVTGILDINRYNLKLSATSNIYDLLTGSAAPTTFGTTKMIATTGQQSDGGITKGFNAIGSFLYPFGNSGAYHPATIAFSQAPSTWGDITIKPVALTHPFVASAGNLGALKYYWNVTSNGFSGIQPASLSHTYAYILASDIVGTEANYITGIYNSNAWTKGATAQVDKINKKILFPSISMIDGDYTAGTPSAFSTITVYYSRQNGDWGTAATWSKESHTGAASTTLPGVGDVAEIGDGAGINHVVTISSNGKIVGGMKLNLGSTLDLRTYTGHNFGSLPDLTVSGSGTLRISSATGTAVFPSGDFGSFLGANGGTVEYYTEAAIGTAFALPTTYITGSTINITNYPNLILSPASGKNITLPNTNLIVFKDLNINTSGTSTAGITQINNTGNSRTLTIYGNLNVNKGNFQYTNGGNLAQNVVVNGNVTVASGAVFDVAAANAATNTLTINGNLTNNGIFDMIAGGTQICNVNFTGASNNGIEGTTAVRTDFNILTVNKGTNRNSILEATVNAFSLNTALASALTLTNGTFRLSTPLTITLSTTNAFTIPFSGCLSANIGIINIGAANNNAGDLLLQGRLEVMNSGVVNIGNGSGSNNDIEYASAGNPELNVSGGSLNVDGQIRRSTANTLGSLWFTQAGGTITVKGKSFDNTRGMFEILNSGSQFNVSGGNLIIETSGSVTTADIYITPASSVVDNSRGGHTLTIGNANTPAGKIFKLNSSAPIWNLTLDGTTYNKTTILQVNPLSILNSLTINSNGSGGSVFQANEMNVTIGGSLINNNSSAALGVDQGGYQAGAVGSTQTTTFTGIGQIIGTNSNLTNFANLTVGTSGTTPALTLGSNSNIRVNNDLKIISGTLADAGNTISVIGNIANFGVHISPSTPGGGIFLINNIEQKISGSGNGIFGNVTINNIGNAHMIDNMVVNGQLSLLGGSMYIDDYSLTLGVNATFSGTFDINHMIVSNGVLSDLGVQKQFSGSVSNFVFPIGTGGNYRPATYSFTSTSGGTIKVIPIAQSHPVDANPPANDQLNYYWKTQVTGFSGLTSSTQIYQYGIADVTGNENNYHGALFSNNVWTDYGTSVINASTHRLTIIRSDLPGGDYTAGEVANFVDKPLLYSAGSGTWSDGTKWSVNQSGVPTYGSGPDGNPVFIQASHVITMDINNASASSVNIEGILDLVTTSHHNIGSITDTLHRGTGTIRVQSTSDGIFLFPEANYDRFMASPGTTVELYGSNNAVIPLKPGNIYKPYQNLILSGTGIKYMSADNLKVLGNLTINNGTQLNNTLYNKNLYIIGNWIDLNTSASIAGFVPGTGVASFEGSSAQTLTVTNSGITENFYDFKINNPSGLTLAGGGNVKVSNLLYLQNGAITSNSVNSFTLTNPGSSIVTGGSVSSFINGPLRKQITAGSSFTFPVGKTGSPSRYGNITLTGVADAGFWEAEYYNGNPTANSPSLNRTSTLLPIDQVSSNEYWRVNGISSTSNANITLRWDANSGYAGSSVATRSKIRLVEWNGTQWVYRGKILNDGGDISGTVSTDSNISLSSTSNPHWLTIGNEGLPTATITSPLTASICNDGVTTTTITVALTGTAPWSLTYKLGSVTTTLSNIATSPVSIVLTSNSAGITQPITANTNFNFNITSINDLVGIAGISDYLKTVVLTVYPIPDNTITGKTYVGTGETVLYSTSADASSYVWTLSGNGTYSSNNTSTFSVKWGTGNPGPYTVGLTKVSSGGCSVSNSISVITSASPTPVITGNQKVCDGSTGNTYSTPLVAGHDYTWTISGNGSITSGANSNSCIVTWNTISTGNTVSVKEHVTSSGSPGVSTTASLLVDVGIQPSSAIPSFSFPPAVCNGNTGTITINNSEVGVRYQLRLNSDNSFVGIGVDGTGGTINLTSTALSTNTTFNIYAYTLAPFNCSAQLTNPSSTFTVVATPLPVATISYSGSPFCSNSGVQTVSISGTGAYTGGTYSAPAGLSIDSGTGAVTPGTSTLGTYAVTYTIPAAGGCSIQIATTSVTINPTSSVANKTTTICSGTAFSVSPVNGTDIVPAGTTYSWSAPVVAGITGTLAGTNAANISGTLTNTTNAAIDVTYTVTPLSGSCTGNTFTVTVTVSPKPSVANKITTICSGTAFSVSPVNGTDIVPTGSTYSWSAPVVSGITGTLAGTNAANISGTLTNTTNAAIDVTYTVTPLSGSCTGNTFTVTVTVSPKPTVANKITTICSGTAFSVSPVNGTDLVPTGSTYSWSAPVVSGITGTLAGTNAANISGTLTNTTNAAIDVTYTVTPLSGSCTGSPFTVTVTVSPKPTIANKTTTICSGTAFSVSPVNGTDIVPTGSTYSWSAPVVAGITGTLAGTNAANISGTLTNTTNAAIDVTYTVTPLSGSCTGNTFTVTVTVIPKPSVANKITTICSGTVFSVSPVNGTDIVPAGTTYSWSAPVVAGITGTLAGTNAANISGTLINTTNAAIDVTYTVTPLSGSCTGNTFTVTVTVSPKPSVANKITTICSGTAFSVSPVNGTDIVPTGSTYSWSAPVVSGITGTLAGTNAANISGTLTNTTNAAIDVTYTVTPLSGSCTGSPFTVIVTVSPKPTVANKITTICSGTAFSVSPVNGTDIVPTGSTYSWSAPVVSGITGTLAGTNAANISGTLTNTTNAAIDVTYTVTPLSGSCTGNTFTVTVTVSPKPTVANKITTICSGTAFSVSPVNGTDLVPTGSTYSWSAPVVSGITGTLAGTNAANISGTLTNTTNAAIDVTYTVTPLSGSCTGNTFTVTVTVSPKPSVANKITTICSGTVFSVSPVNGTDIVPAGTTYSWSAPVVAGITGTLAGTNAANISGTLINTTNAAIDVTYTVTPLSGSCTGNTFTVTVTVSPKPSVANKITTICSGTAFSVSPVNGTDIVPTGSTYSWSAPVVSGITGTLAGTNAANISGTLTNTTNAAIDVTYTVTPLSGSCTGNTFTVTVTVSPKPTVANKITTICSGTAFSVSPVNGTDIVPTGSTYSWSAPVVSGITGTLAGTNAANISGTLTNTTNAAIDVTYTVTPLSGSCTGNTFTVTVTVSPKPTVANKITTICSGTAFSVSPVNGTDLVPTGSTYSWSAPVVSGITGTLAGTNAANISGTLTNTTNAAIDVTYTVTPLSGSCTGNTFTVTVTVSPKPTVANKITTICSGTAFSVSPVNGTDIVPAGTTYSWSAPVVAGITGTLAGTNAANISGTLINTTNAAIDVTYTVTPLSGSCTGNTFTVTVTVSPKPSVANKTTTICSGTAFSVSPVNGTDIVPAGTTYSWSAPVVAGITGTLAGTNAANISGTLTNTTNAAIDVTYTVTPLSGSCTGNTFTVTVTVSPKPSVANKITTICSGTAFSVSPVNGTDIVPTGSTYSWSAPVVSGITGTLAGTNAANISGTLTNTTNAAIDVTYTVTPLSGSCTGNTFTVTVTVSPKPTVANKITTICSGTAFSVSPVNGTDLVPTGSTYSWSAPVVSGITGTLAGTNAANISGTLTNTTNAAIDVTYTVTPLSGSCTGSPFTVTVTVSPKPTIANKTTTICSGTAFSVSPVNGTDIVPTGSTYSWSAPVVAGITGTLAGTNAANISGTLTNTTNAAIDVTYTVTPLSGSCTGNTFTVTVTVSPKPSVANKITTICSGTAFSVSPVNGTDIVPTGSTYSWSAPVVSGITGTLAGTNAANISGTLTNTTNEVLIVTYIVTPTSGSCNGNTFTLIVTVNPDGSWTGVVDNDWNNPGNWACNEVPSITTDVIIGNGRTPYPILSSGSNGTTNNLTIGNNASVTVIGNTLQIGGAISNTGTFTASAGTIEMKGVAAQTIGSNVFAGNTIMNLTLNNPAGTTLQGPLYVTGIVLATNGDLASGGNLTLVSTAAQTALIDGSGTGSITGNVTMQRYLPSAFGYKYMSSPFQSATVNEFAEDLDLTATFPTFYYYDEDNHRDSSNVAVSKSGWVKYIIPADYLAPLKGYAANFGSVSVVKTVDMTGFVNNGLLQMNLMNHNWKYTNGFNLIGNPYPSPIDWKAVNGWTKMNIDDAIWFFNVGSDQYTGYYTSYVNGVSSGNANNIIASMQGFFVHVTDGAYPVSATLGLNNSVRINDLNPTFKRAHVENRSILRFSASFETKNAIEDAAVIYFDDLASRSFDHEMDALKLMNTDLLVPNIYTLSPETEQLSINGMPFLTDSITKIPLGITTFSDGWMNFNAKDISQLPTELNVYLYDAEKSIMQNLDESPEYRFFLKAGEHNQRFTLVFSYSEIVEPSNSTEKMFAFSRSSDFLTIKMNLPSNSKGNLMVTNMLGQILLRKEVSEKETVEVKLNVSTGVYIVTLISGNRKESQKILMRKDYE